MTAETDTARNLKILEDALDTGNPALARPALAQLERISPRKAAYLLEGLICQRDFAQQAQLIRGDYPLLGVSMAKDANSYEQGLAEIARGIAQRRDMNDPAFKNLHMFAFTYSGEPARQPATIAIVQEAIRQNTSWRPNIPGHFSNIGEEQTWSAKETQQYRQGVADQINTVGAAVTQWIKETPSVAMRMSAPDQAWWREKSWQTDPDQMPKAGPEQALRDQQLLQNIFGTIPPELKVIAQNQVRAREVGAAAISHLLARSKGPS